MSPLIDATMLDYVGYESSDGTAKSNEGRDIREHCQSSPLVRKKIMIVRKTSSSIARGAFPSVLARKPRLEVVSLDFSLSCPT